ncbi:MAG: DUF5615 family PIN-like protein [Chloroflexi bacterium]|nr:DUF5615 family PIN-like protein [Chloroflexota bacterium]
MADFLADENVSHDIVRLLIASGHTAATAREQRLTKAADDQVLLFATERGSILLTHDVADFQLLHDAWLRWTRAWGVLRQHACILTVQHHDVPDAEVVQAIESLLNQGLPLPNELYRWRRVGGWQRRVECKWEIFATS